MNGNGIAGMKSAGLTSEDVESPSAKGLVTVEKATVLSETEVRLNGPSDDDVGSLGSVGRNRIESLAKESCEEDVVEKAVGTPSKANSSSSGGSGWTPTPKGYGLKKWRRIRRDLGKEGGSGADFSRNLKRAISEPSKVRDSSGDNRQKSEGSGSVASANSALKNMVFSASPIGGLDLESILAVGVSFPIGTDSENSEGQSSKSTAASAPKLRRDVSIGTGSAKEKVKGKNPGGRGSGGSAYRGQSGKGKVETSKKLRGERVRAEKENSHSSVESDLRSSSATFMLVGGFSAVGDGRQRGRSLNCSGENSDEVHLSEPQSSEEFQADFCKENGEEVEVISRDVVPDVSGEEKKEECEKDRQDMNRDPFVESIILLQNVQETLEKEVKEFGEIGSGSISLFNGSSHVIGVSHNVLLGETKESDSPPFGSEVIEPTQRVIHLEHELKVTSAALKAKEAKVLELESILNNTQLPEHMKDRGVLPDEEIELEDLFKKRLEAEVEYLMMTRMTQKMKLTSNDDISLLFREQKSLAEEQEQILIKLREAENKATVLKKQAEELEASCKELLETAEVSKVQESVYKFSLCFFIQLVLLCIVFGLFLLQLLPNSAGFVPT